MNEQRERGNHRSHLVEPRCRSSTIAFLYRFDLSIEGHRWTLTAKREAERVAQGDAAPDQALRTGRSAALDARPSRRGRWSER